MSSTIHSANAQQCKSAVLPFRMLEIVILVPSEINEFNVTVFFHSPHGAVSIKISNRSPAILGNRSEPKTRVGTMVFDIQISRNGKGEPKGGKIAED